MRHTVRVDAGKAVQVETGRQESYCMWGDRVLRSEVRDVLESAGRTCQNPVLADFREIIETERRGCRREGELATWLFVLPFRSDPIQISNRPTTLQEARTSQPVPPRLYLLLKAKVKIKGPLAARH